MRGLFMRTGAAAVVAAVCVLLLWVGAPMGNAPAQTDTVHYTEQAYEFLGDPPDQASAKAIKLVCDDKTEYIALSRAACEKDAHGVLGFPKPYQDIFKARPGFPLFVAPFLAAFGENGMFVAVFILQAAAGVLIAAAAYALGLRKLWPLAAVLAYFLLPSGYVGTRFLTEAATAPGYAALLLAVAWLVTGQRRNAALGLIAGTFVWLFVVREADALPAAALLCVASLAVLRVDRTARWAKPLALVGGVGAGVMAAVAAVLGWPSVKQGITDTLTQHFTEPAPANLSTRLIHVEFSFWRVFFQQISSGLYLIALAVLGLAALPRAMRAARSLPFLALAAVGPVSLLVHPGDWPRMLAPMWIVVAFGLALLHEGRDGVRREPAVAPDSAYPLPGDARHRRVVPERNPVTQPTLESEAS
jgi:hypothetical protein